MNIDIFTDRKLSKSYEPNTCFSIMLPLKHIKISDNIKYSSLIRYSERIQNKHKLYRPLIYINNGIIVDAFEEIVALAKLNGVKYMLFDYPLSKERFIPLYEYMLSNKKLKKSVCVIDGKKRICLDNNDYIEYDGDRLYYYRNGKYYSTGKYNTLQIHGDYNF